MSWEIINLEVDLKLDMMNRRIRTLKSLRICLRKLAQERMLRRFFNLV